MYFGGGVYGCVCVLANGLVSALFQNQFKIPTIQSQILSLDHISKTLYNIICPPL